MNWTKVAKTEILMILSPLSNLLKCLKRPKIGTKAASKTSVLNKP